MNMLLSFSGLIGRFHPVLVHLPIGILLLACVFQLLTVKNRFTLLQPAIPIMLGWGMISAVASCVSGYLLSRSGDYDGQLVDRHQWLGISVAIISLLFYILYRLSVGEVIARGIAAVLIVLIIITGHLGGSLTHGSDYLAEGWNSGDASGPALKPVPNIQEAVLYKDVVQPLLQARCYNCHGPNKQKGKLRLDQQDLIMKGGEDGKVLVPGKTDESKMIERLLLPVNDKDHMPPREKPQLTTTEISLLHWWISTGADFNRKVKELPQPEQIKPVLSSLQSGSPIEENKTPDVPAKAVTPADPAMITRLKNAGVIVIPVAQKSNYLSVSFVTATKGADSLVKLLVSLQDQLVWLKLDHAAITDASLDDIVKCKALTRLHLSHTDITDKGVSKLQALPQLLSLNLVGTKVTAQGLLSLKGLKNLKHLYLYQSNVQAADWQALRQAFSATQLDSGKYLVPTLAEDTTIVKPPAN